MRPRTNFQRLVTNQLSAHMDSLSTDFQLTAEPVNGVAVDFRVDDVSGACTNIVLRLGLQEESQGAVFIDYLEVLPLYRGQGYASVVLEILTEVADELERTLELNVGPYAVPFRDRVPPRSSEFLAEFYQRHGFAYGLPTTIANRLHMTRRPKSRSLQYV